jgi:hypothetical protein
MSILSNEATACNELTPHQQLSRFLEPFTHKPDYCYVAFWSAPSKRSLFVQEINDGLIEQLIAQGDAGEDVYISVGLSPRDYGTHHRCPADEIAGIVGLWADVDVAGPAHRKLNLPPSEAAALDLITEMCAPPSVLINSGHGIHAWWLFKEPWVFADAIERAKAARLAERWIGTLKVKARAHGWDVDSVHDLARLMRLPGLFNWKGAR